MHKSITKVKKSIQRITEDTLMHEDEEAYAARRLRNIPRESLNSMAYRTGFAKEEIRRLFRAFKQACPNGVATIKELTPAYVHLFPLGDSRKYAKLVFKNFDQDRDGVVTFSDLLNGLAIVTKGSVDQKLSWIFRFYDLNENGYITKRKMIENLTAIYEMVKNARTIGIAVEKHVDELFKRMDLNRDGFISKEEFFQICKNDKAVFTQLMAFADLEY